MTQIQPRRGLLIVDVQRDFTEGGALAVAGGAAVAKNISLMLGQNVDRYARLYVSQDWHNPLPDLNGGHFAAPGEQPDFVNTWPVHCVAETEGADLHPDLVLGWDGTPVVPVRKGQGRPDYSAFQGVTVPDDFQAPATLTWTLGRDQIEALDVVGIATDYCVRESTLHALALVESQRLREVRIIADLMAGVAEKSSGEAIADLVMQGAELMTTKQM